VESNSFWKSLDTGLADIVMYILHKLCLWYGLAYSYSRSCFP